MDIDYKKFIKFKIFEYTKIMKFNTNQENFGLKFGDKYLENKIECIQIKLIVFSNFSKYIINIFRSLAPI